MRSFDFSNSHYFLFLLTLFNINLAFKGREQAASIYNSFHDTRFFYCGDESQPRLADDA